MKIALFGYGKMGKLIESQAARRGHQVTLRLDSQNTIKSLPQETLAGVDVCIDFSSPGAVAENVRLAVLARRPIVVGTTGWSNELASIKDYVNEHKGALVYGSNFSLGMNVFFRIVEQAARLLADSEEFDVFMVEQHHKMKKDAPSGTALVLKRIITENLPGRDCDVAVVRAGHIPGTHEVGFDSEADTITLKHVARNRTAFASGAVTAAEWIVDKQGVFEFQEVIFGLKG